MKKGLLFVVAMLLSLSSYATIYLVETGSGNETDRVWRVAGEGEMNVNLKDAEKNLQQYINGQAMTAGDEIWIAGGTYIVGAVTNPKANGTYYGGFSGKETKTADRPRADLDKNGFVEPWEFQNLSIIDANEGKFQCVLINGQSNITVDGWVIQNVKNGGTQASAIRTTGAMENVKIANCIVRNNETTNSSTIYAGTVEIGPAGALLEYSLIENNTAGTGTNAALYGAGVTIGSGTVRGCVIRGNKNLQTGGNAQGGGVRMGAGKLQNCLIYNNSTGGRGGGVYTLAGTGSVEYCTIVNNTASAGNGAGFHAITAAAGGATIVNSIVMNNYVVSTTTLNNFGQNIAGGVSPIGSNNAYDGAKPAWFTNDGYAVTAALADVFNKPTTTAGSDVESVELANWTIKSDVAANYQIGAAIEGVTTDFVGNDRPAENACVGVYEPKTFAFTAAAGANGAITGANGNYYGTAVIALSATPNANYALANWTDKSGAVVSAEPSFAFAMPLDAVELTANFEESYALTILAGENGTASIDKSGGYASGAEIGLTATASEGYKFAAWKDAVADTIVSEIPNFTYTMPAAVVTLKATFGLSYELTVQAGANGTASIGKTGTYFENTSVALTATPADGYSFKDWTSGESVISTVANFTYTTTAADVTLRANFYSPEPKVYLIETGAVGDKTWRAATPGEEKVTLSVSLDSWIAATELHIGDQLWLAGGTYALDATVTTKKGIAIYGGFAGSETAVADRTHTDHDENGAVEPWEFTNLSIIDAATIEDRKTARVITVKGGEVVVDGLVAQGGEWIGYNASGINVAGGSHIQNLIIRNNKSVSPDNNAVWGGGLALGGDAVADGCLIENNYSEAGTANYAAGVDAVGTSMILNCVIRGNESYSRGANNYGGGGLRLIGTATAVNCLIYNNKATNGSGVYLGSSGKGHVPSLLYCTIVNNLTTGTSMNALGVNYSSSTTTPNIANCLIMNNLNGGGAVANIFDTSAVMYCAYDGAALANSANSLNVTETPEAVFIAPTKYVGMPVDEASLVANLALKNGTQFQFGAEIEEDETDFWGVIRTVPSFVGAIENKQVALTVVAGTGGSTSSSSGSYYIGEKVELTATANSNLIFVNWTDQDGKIISTEPNFTYIMAEKEITLTANFGKGTGIAANQIEANIYATNGTLYVSNEAPAEVMVYSYTGQKIAMSEAATSHALPLAKGAYVVVVSNEHGRVSTPVLVK